MRRWYSLQKSEKGLERYGIVNSQVKSVSFRRGTSDARRMQLTTPTLDNRQVSAWSGRVFVGKLTSNPGLRESQSQSSGAWESVTGGATGYSTSISKTVDYHTVPDGAQHTQGPKLSQSP